LGRLIKPRSHGCGCFAVKAVVAGQRQDLPGRLRLAVLNKRIDIAEPELAIRRLRVERGVQVGKSGSRLIDLDGQDAKIVVSHGVRRVGLQDQLVEQSSLLEFAGALMCDCHGQSLGQ
jgi:hypothetical protein